MGGEEGEGEYRICRLCSRSTTYEDESVILQAPEMSLPCCRLELIAKRPRPLGERVVDALWLQGSAVCTQYCNTPYICMHAHNPPWSRARKSAVSRRPFSLDFARAGLPAIFSRLSANGCAERYTAPGTTCRSVHTYYIR